MFMSMHLLRGHSWDRSPEALTSNPWPETSFLVFTGPLEGFGAFKFRHMYWYITLCTHAHAYAYIHTHINAHIPIYIIY